MARLARYFVKGQPLHVVQRGNNREAIFVAEDDYRLYLECLQEAAERQRLGIHAYVLMTNHVHLLATPVSKSEPAQDAAIGGPPLSAIFVKVYSAAPVSGNKLTARNKSA